MTPYISESMNRSTLAIGLATVLLACSNNRPTAPTDVPHIFLAEVNGFDFVARGELFAHYRRGVVSIAARDADGRTIHLTFLSDLSSGTVDLGENSPNSGTTSVQQAYWRTNLSGGHGRIEILEADPTHIKGTFEFRAVAVPQTPASGRLQASGSFDVLFPRDTTGVLPNRVR